MKLDINFRSISTYLQQISAHIIDVGVNPTDKVIKTRIKTEMI